MGCPGVGVGPLLDLPDSASMSLNDVLLDPGSNELQCGPGCPSGGVVLDTSPY